MPHFTQKVEPRGAVLGLDIAKDTVAIHDSVTSTYRVVDNKPAALRKVFRACIGYDLALCESTGGYERPALDAAWELGLPIHRADPSKAKAFITSHGGNAKTDKADAQWLARMALERGESLARWSPPDPDIEVLACLVRHRDDLLRQRTQAKNRLSAPNRGPVAKLLRAEIKFLTNQIKTLDEQMAQCRAKPAIKPRSDVLLAIPGIGPVVANTLIGLLPEIGALTRRQVASLCGLAPHPRDSGQFTGKRRTYGGRCELKTALFMAALSVSRTCPTLSAYYDKLIDAGKPKMVALTAIARKIAVIANARVRDANLAEAN